MDPGGPATALGHLCMADGCMPVADIIRIVVLSSSALLVALVGLSYLSIAREALADEHRRVATEVTAFDQFADRIAAADPQPLGQNARSGGPTMLVDSTTDGLQEVRRAYQETVMAVDHYEEDYAEPLAEHMREELGPDVATAVLNGPGFTPEVQTALVDAARTACEARQGLLSQLDDEAAALTAAGNKSSDIQQAVGDIRDAPRIAGFDTLVGRWQRLDALEERCLETVRERYRSLTDRDAVELTAYLYDDLPLPAPVLAEAATTLGAVRKERRRTCRMLTRLV
jgi:hypothetical protein